MCTKCGCDVTHAEPQDAHGHADGSGDWHHHGDGHWHRHPDGHAGAPAPRTVAVETDILARNDAIAQGNRQRLVERGIFALNLLSSPGSGKTTLVVETVKAWAQRGSIAVVQGDQHTSIDADRVRAAGAEAVQINTGQGCHLDARMVAGALDALRPADRSLLLIENVGNLVCPAPFDLGEARKVVVLSVTEGDDKPLKYADMFHAADLLLVSKTDLLPYVDFDLDAAVRHARAVQPGLQVIPLSVRTGQGMADWLDWLEAGLANAIRVVP